MAKLDRELNRLLANAARVPDNASTEMPFGFDTRIVALAKEKRSAEGRESRQLNTFLHRMALAAVMVTAFASSAAYWQMSQNEDATEPLSNAYAIADTAIDADFFQ
ncbi:MAG: hypothetical protein ABI946_12400 [Chthoniobacterales bacterium]